ncbi:MAG: molybdenum cofactor guanylyltransferase MobA [Cytophagales bacterium]|nr:molybdenum cofactor guanylyltransferase MobA [Rhizobacter sp.]
MVEPREITGLILAGGQGSRLGGVDKGLQDFAGQPLARHALQRLAPQVGHVMISANRNLDVYRSLGVPVWPDAPSSTGYEGPLAGFLAGLQHCETPYLVTVPCDCPHFPVDLVKALAKADAEIAIAATRHGNETKLEPAFCLMKRELADSLLRYLQTGQRKIERWTAQHRRAEVVFDDVAAFFNINTPDDLARG